MLKFLKQMSTAVSLMIGLGITGLSTTALAEETEKLSDTSYIRIGAGQYDVFGEDEHQTGTGHIEYIHGESLFAGTEWYNEAPLHKVKPFFGFMGTGDSASYVYAGIRLDHYVNDNFLIAPSFAPGIYSDGDGKDLGHGIEFRSGIELAYEFDNKIRIGSTLYHLSNAGIGDSNPGTEVINLHISIPVSQ